jgi:hypothetical protein
MDAGSTFSSSRSDRCRSTSSAARARTASPNSSTAANRAASRTASLSTGTSASLATRVRKATGAATNQAVTTSDQPRWPAAQAVNRATASGTAGKIPGKSST